MRLLRADAENGHFEALEREWSEQIRRLADFEEYESVRLAHARGIVAEDPQPKNYGIFVVVDESDETDHHYKAFVHVNHAFPKTSSATLRMVWVVMAPKYDFEDPDTMEVAEITTTILYGGVELCQTAMTSYALKMHLGGSIDRGYASGIASNLRREMPFLKSAVRGNWLHLDGIPHLENGK